MQWCKLCTVCISEFFFHVCFRLFIHTILLRYNTLSERAFWIVWFNDCLYILFRVRKCTVFQFWINAHFTQKCSFVFINNFIISLHTSCSKNHIKLNCYGFVLHYANFHAAFLETVVQYQHIICNIYIFITLWRIKVNICDLCLISGLSLFCHKGTWNYVNNVLKKPRYLEKT